MAFVKASPGAKNLQAVQSLYVTGTEFRYWPYDTAMVNPVFNDCFVAYNTTSKYVQALSNSNWNYFVGLAMLSAPVPGYSGYSGTLGVPSVPPNAIILATFSLPGGILVCTRGMAYMYATTGDAYSPGNSLYLGVDARTITSVNPGSAPSIGVVAGQQAAVTSAVAGSLIYVDFKANWPTNA